MPYDIDHPVTYLTIVMMNTTHVANATGSRIMNLNKYSPSNHFVHNPALSQSSLPTPLREINNPVGSHFCLILYKRP